MMKEKLYELKVIMGFIKNKILLFIFVFIIFFINIVCLFYCSSVLGFNINNSYINEIYENKIENVLIKPDIYSYTIGDRFNWYFFTADKEYIQDVHNLTKDELGVNELIYCYNGLEKRINNEFVTIFDYQKHVTFDSSLLNYKENDVSVLEYFSIKPYLGIVESNGSENYIDFVLDERIINKEICHYPKEYNQVAISSLKANMYIEYGFKDENGQVINVDSVDSLIGKQIDGYTITAVYKFEDEMNYIMKIKDEMYKNLNFRNVQPVFSNLLFMKKGAIKNFGKTINDNVADYQDSDYMNWDWDICFKLPNKKLDAISFFNKIANFRIGIYHFKPLFMYNYAKLGYSYGNNFANIVERFTFNLWPVFFLQIISGIASRKLLSKFMKEYKSVVSEKFKNKLSNFLGFIMILGFLIIVPISFSVLSVLVINRVMDFTFINFGLVSFIVFTTIVSVKVIRTCFKYRRL